MLLAHCTRLGVEPQGRNFVVAVIARLVLEFGHMLARHNVLTILLVLGLGATCSVVWLGVLMQVLQLVVVSLSVLQHGGMASTHAQSTLVAVYTQPICHLQ